MVIVLVLFVFALELIGVVPWELLKFLRVLIVPVLS